MPHEARWHQRLAAALVYAVIRCVAATVRFEMNDVSGLFQGAPQAQGRHGAAVPARIHHQHGEPWGHLNKAFARGVVMQTAIIEARLAWPPVPPGKAICGFPS